MNKMSHPLSPFTFLLFLLLSLLLASCRTGDEPTIPSQVEHVGTGVHIPSTDTAAIRGFYLLNEGNMGSNKCTLDYYDALTGNYHRNIYGEANPDVVHELGDMGNDLQVYDGKLWAVINQSNLVEVMDAATARHITQLSIPNCRHITFHDRYAYVSSFAGPVDIDPTSQLGYVARIDIDRMTIVDTCVVGYQPEELVVHDDHLYVANSGGYRYPNYDRTVSVIDLSTFTVTDTIDVAFNLHSLQVDPQGYIWVSSLGDYYTISPKTYVVDPTTRRVCDSLDIVNSSMAMAGDSLYIYGAEWSYAANGWVITYHLVDTRTREVIADHFITDDTEQQIVMPYAVAVNPTTRELYITDAGDFIAPGKVYCFTPEGQLQWKATTGNTPSRIAFTSTPHIFLK